MDINNVDFNNERSEDCVLVDTKSWVNGGPIKVHKLSGRDVNTHITKALKVNAVKKVLQGIINSGDTILLTRVAAEVAPDRAFAVEDEKRYYHVPILQVIGIFKEGEISYNSLKILFNRVLVEKVEPEYDTFFVSPNDNAMVGKIVKLGIGCLNNEWKLNPYQVNIGDVVLIKDNVATEIYLNGHYYYAVEESMIVGRFNRKPYTLSTMEVMNKSILMSEYIPGSALNSILLTPDLVYEDLDFTELYNRNLFKVITVDSDLTKIKRDDILLVLRDLTNYVYFNLEKYFIINGTEFVEAKVEQ